MLVAPRTGAHGFALRRKGASLLSRLIEREHGRTFGNRDVDTCRKRKDVNDDDRVARANKCGEARLTPFKPDLIRRLIVPHGLCLSLPGQSPGGPAGCGWWPPPPPSAGAATGGGAIATEPLPMFSRREA